jgi:DNA-binding NarL/FixJ family response regulator
MKLLIVDDHPVLRAGLAALLGPAGSDNVILQAGTATEAFGVVEQHADLDIVVLDLLMPGMGGLPALAEFGRRRPELPVIVLSSSEDPYEARRALALGALGYVPKSAGQRTLVAAINLVLDGEIYLPPLLLNEPVAGAKGAGRGGRIGASPLTERQIEVLRRLSQGQPNKTIASELELSEKTVKAHITAIFRTLNVVNRTQAAAVGREAGLL